MKHLTYTQKLSMMRILMDIIMADGLVKPKEMEFYSAIANAWEMDEKALAEVLSIDSTVALTTIKELSREQKEEFSQIMGQMIVADKDINYNEVRIYNEVNESCTIDVPFEADKYPDVTFS